MTEVLAATRARLYAEPPSARDVEERIAARLADDEERAELVAVLAIGEPAPAVRLFAGARHALPHLLEARREGSSVEWASAYVRRLEDVDGLLDELHRKASDRACKG